MSDIKNWLSEELDRRGWSHSQLARRAGLSQAMVSRVLSGERVPGADFCIKIALALEEPPERLLRLAGILPPLLAPDDPTIREVLEILPHLSLEKRRDALRYIRYLYRSKQEAD